MREASLSAFGRQPCLQFLPGVILCRRALAARREYFCAPSLYARRDQSSPMNEQENVHRTREGRERRQGTPSHAAMMRERCMRGVCEIIEKPFHHQRPSHACKHLFANEVSTSVSLSSPLFQNYRFLVRESPNHRSPRLERGGA